MRVFTRFLLSAHTPIPPARKDGASFLLRGTCHVIEQTVHPTTGTRCLCVPETAQLSTGGAGWGGWVLTERMLLMARGPSI